MEISKDQKVDMRSTQSFGVGKIKPPNWLWSSLGAVLVSESVRNGVLIIHSEQVSGRVGVFCNRYISGAKSDRTGLTGMDALKLLLSIKSGMFAFRPCLASEGAELKQDLALDIQEILDARSTSGETATPADVVAPELRPEQMESIHFSDGSDMSELADSLGTGGLFYTPVTAVPVLKPKATVGLEHDDHSDSLKPAILIPEIEEAHSQVTTGGFDLSKYIDLVEHESEKISQQLKNAMSDLAVGVTPKAEMMDDLRLFGEMLKAEGNRVKGWLQEDLNAIATPNVGAGGKSPASQRGQFAAACDDLVSEHLIAKIKESQKPQAEPAPATAEQQPAERRWLQHPKVLSAATVAVAVAVTVIGYVSLTARDTAGLLDKGTRALSDNKPQEALVYFDDAVKKSPDLGRAYLCRGLAYASLNQAERALPDLTKALSLGQSKTIVLPARASMESLMHDYDKAIEDCTNAIVDDSQNVDAYRVRAICHVGQQHYGEAIADCTYALKYASSDAMRAALLCERGSARARNDDPEGAVSDLSESLKLKADQWAYFQRAEAYRSMKKFAEAEVDYAQALKSNPTSYVALVGRGISRVKLKQYDEAMNDFDLAIKLNHAGVEALIQRGNLELTKELWQAAADDFQQANQLNDNLPESQQQLGVALAHLKNAPPPLKVADVQEKENEIKLPDDVPSLMKVGYDYLNKGNFDDAVLCFDRAVSKEPRSAEPRRYLAYTYAQKGDYSQAVMYLQTLQGIQPLTSQDRVVMARALAGSGQPESATDTLAELLNKDENYIPAYAELARIYMHRGMPEKAKEIVNKGLTRASSPADKIMIEGALAAAPTPSAKPATTPSGGAGGKN
ncbi:MAG TPA: tetratricopeptide repeat protein [Candidatus Obscuribacterales bacterium]